MNLARTRATRASVICVCLLFVLSACAKTPTTAKGEPRAVPSSVSSSAPDSLLPIPGVATTPTGTPTSTTTPTPVVAKAPTDPLAGLSAARRSAYRKCLKKSIGPGSGTTCAKLLQKSLKSAGFYPWRVAGALNVAGVNALLNYQRSRGIPATGRTNKTTWIALATKAAQVPVNLPKKCKGKGVVLCVDQAHRKLFYVKNGSVTKTIKVRLGGYNSHPKTNVWRVFPTANGTWKVYDKQVSPQSENYGSGAMPYSVMFYPDMYVHYSPGFHRDGYRKSSHGCVNVGSLRDAIWIFKHTPIGARVHIFSAKK